MQCRVRLTLRAAGVSRLLPPAWIVLLIMMLQGCGAASWQHPPTRNDQQMLYVVSHGWHTGIILPTAELLPALSFLRQDVADGPYVEIGWVMIPRP